MKRIISISARVCAVLCVSTMFYVGCSTESKNTEETTTQEEKKQGQEKIVESDQKDAGTQETTAEAPPKEEVAEEPATQKYSFPNEINPCKVNAKFEALKPILGGGKNNPTGRGEQGSVYDPCNGRVILFGGNDYQPEQCADFGPKRFKGDTWIYVMEYKNWVKVKTDTAPSARGRQATAFDKSRKLMYLFGGRYRAEAASGSYEMYNDLWAFDVNTDTWTEVQTTGNKPFARSNSAMVYDEFNDRLVLFGGNTSPSGLAFNALDDTYTLDLKTKKWTRHYPKTSPSKRLFHAMVLDGKFKRVIMYSGGGNNAFTGPFINDVWALDLGTMEWELLWEKKAGNIGPPARINASLIEDRDNGVIVMFGGHDDTAIGHRNDLWLFYLEQKLWQQKKAGDTGTGAGCSSFCRCAPDFVQVDIKSPERRQYQAFTRVIGKPMALLFGGKTDCGYIDDTWYLDFKDGKYEWTEINSPSQGEACKRTGRQDCKELCY
ncbi:MAG TPA: hypothetical protein DCE42_00235 [Myxococcales bacterium]|nr:hypothetical protein [Deltaproteobacteria bacterium]MBU54919.1 hypothetical protein [Deltaproteobacteria bacterium]HAA53148.1 hypothetical protein [Myxococcales bacterium]